MDHLVHVQAHFGHSDQLVELFDGDNTLLEVGNDARQLFFKAQTDDVRDCFAVMIDRHFWQHHREEVVSDTLLVFLETQVKWGVVVQVADERNVVDLAVRTLRDPLRLTVATKF